MWFKSNFEIPAIAAVCICLIGGTVPVAADIITVPGDYPTIQAAIDAAMNGNEVVVAPGTYFEAINFLGKAITLRSSDGPEVTTIDGTGHFHVVQCVSGEGSDTVLDGFIITGGNADGEFPDFNGGGMLNIDSSPIVTNCTFTENLAGNLVGEGGKGGGMHNRDSSPIVTNCTFIDNLARIHGGGMSITGGSPIVVDCTFIRNTGGNGSLAKGGGGMSVSGSATVRNCVFSFNRTNETFSPGHSPNWGGGMWIFGGSPTVDNCTFSRNIVKGYGGGIAISDSSPTVFNCTISENRAIVLFGGTGGGGISNDGGSLTVTNCTITGNLSEEGGAGMFNNGFSDASVTNCTFSGNDSMGFGGTIRMDLGSSLTILNCVLWGNKGSEEEIIGDATVTYSDVQFGYDGIGNIDADPLFVDPDNGDFRLSPNSPCIDAGDNSAVPKGIETDLDGNPRFVDDPCTVDTGIGGPPTVDMGAYEFQDSSCLVATLTACDITFGSTDNPPCDVANLVDDDDIDQILRSQFGFSAFERNLTEIVIEGNGVDATSMASIDTRDGSDTTNVVAKVRARNYATISIDDIAQYNVSFPSDDTSHTTPVNSTDYVDANGDIEVRLRYVAPATFTPLGFTVGLDQVEVMVE